MALEHRRVADVDDRWQRALLVVANLLPLAAYAVGSLPFLEAFLVYLLEPPIAAFAMAGKLLVVDSPPGQRSERTLLALDRDWLASPLRVTTWNLGQALRHVCGYLLAFFTLYGIVAVALLGVADSTPSVRGYEALTAASLALLVGGFAVGRLRDLALFVLGRDERRSDPDAVLDRSDRELQRLYQLSIVYGVLGFAGLELLAAVPGLALLGIVASKTWVDLLYEERSPAAA